MGGVEGVAALLRRNGLAEQALGRRWEDKKKQGAGQQAAWRTTLGHPLSHENTVRPSPEGRISKGRVGGPDKAPQGEGTGTLGADAKVLTGGWEDRKR